MYTTLFIEIEASLLTNSLWPPTIIVVYVLIVAETLSKAFSNVFIVVNNEWPGDFDFNWLKYLATTSGARDKCWDTTMRLARESGSEGAWKYKKMKSNTVIVIIIHNDKILVLQYMIVIVLPFK